MGPWLQLPVIIGLLTMLVVLGISGGSYAVSKGIAASVAKSNPATQSKGAPENSDVAPVPPAAGQNQ